MVDWTSAKCPNAFSVDLSTERQAFSLWLQPSPFPPLTSPKAKQEGPASSIGDPSAPPPRRGPTSGRGQVRRPHAFSVHFAEPKPARRLGPGGAEGLAEGLDFAEGEVKACRWGTPVL